MKNEIKTTPVKSFLVNLENKINTIKKINIELDIKEQFMLQKLTTLINLLSAVDDGIKEYPSSHKSNGSATDENLLKDITIYANRLFIDFDLTYEELLNYYKSIISIYNIIKK